MKPGEALDIESQIFSDWIIGHYQDMSDLQEFESEASLMSLWNIS